MSVAELIERLRELPQDAPVAVIVGIGEYLAEADEVGLVEPDDRTVNELAGRVCVKIRS